MIGGKNLVPMLVSGVGIWNAFRGQNPGGVMLNGVCLADADLARADLRGAFLLGSDLKGANLEFSFLQAADLRGADLSTAQGLTSGQLLETLGDSNTRLPEDLPRPAWWSRNGKGA